MDTLMLMIVIMVGVFSTLMTLFIAGWTLFAVPQEQEQEQELEVELELFSPLREDLPPGGVVHALQVLAAPDDQDTLETMRQTMQQAGLRDAYALEYMLAVRTALTLSLPLLCGFVFQSQDTARLLFMCLLAAGLGYYSPMWLVQSWQAGRQKRIGRAVPNVMDMLVSCLEAGLGIDGALRHASREIRVASPELADELDGANSEVQAGIPRMEALKRMDDRTGVKELSALITVLGHAERYGAGAAQAIRAQSRLSRQRRALDAERRAAQAAPQLTVAMITFILPALFVVLLGPSVVKIMGGSIPFFGGG